MEQLKQHIEAMIFASDRAISVGEICENLGEAVGLEIDELEVRTLIGEISEKYLGEDFAFALQETGGGYQFLTKAQYFQTVSIFSKNASKRKLSDSALETLAIIAYKQPVSKSEIEQIRGVKCDYALHRLLEKELIIISGRSAEPGKPLQYTTSQRFMDYFGINSVSDLPKLKEVQPEEDNVIGEAEPTEN